MLEGARRAQGQERASRGVLRDHQGRGARAVAEPRDLSLDLVNAQQARRALDYLVGFNLSPLLWKKVRRGLSAGRVQSPALRMICEREHEISPSCRRNTGRSRPKASTARRHFPLKLVEFDGKKVEQFSFTNEAAGARRRTVPQATPRRVSCTSCPSTQAAPPQSVAAVHHLHAAAGGRAQARLFRAAHHAPRAAAI